MNHTGDNEPLWKNVLLTIVGFLGLGIYMMGIWRIWEILDIFQNASNLIRDISTAVLWVLMLGLVGFIGVALDEDHYFREENETKRAMFSSIAVGVYGIGIEGIIREISGSYSSVLKIVFLLCALADLAYMAHDTAIKREELVYQSGYKDGYLSVLLEQEHEETEKNSK